MTRNNVLATVLTILLLAIAGCAGQGTDNDNTGRSRALRMQRLRNLSPGEDALHEMRLTVDSMRRDSRDIFYFASANVLIDQLFSLDHISEADSLASLLVEEATSEANSKTLASARRVKGQILYKLGQPQAALREFELGRGLLRELPDSIDEFSTAASLDEWIWIAARSAADSAHMRSAALRYAAEVERQRNLGWTDSTRHFEVTALALRGSSLLADAQTAHAGALLDSASKLRIPSLPVRAYEHLYSVKADLSAATGRIDSAIALTDTLIAAHADFPWFKGTDLLRRAEFMARCGSAADIAEAYNKYIAFDDSLFAARNDARIRELTVLYGSELERGERIIGTVTLASLCAILSLLCVLLILSVRSNRKERKKNLILVQRLHELDRIAAERIITQEDEYVTNDKTDCQQPSFIDRLDRYMQLERPYTNPGLGRRELAAAIRVSQEELARIIRSERDMTVLAYINAARLEAARHLLECDKETPIAEIAESLGFGTARTLQRAFKSRYDMTPSQYRDLTLNHPK